MRIISEHFRADGKPKKTYSTRRLAEEAAIRCNKDCYRCGFCGGLHIGSYSARPGTRKFA